MWNFLFPLTDLFITSPIEYIGDKRFDLNSSLDILFFKIIQINNKRI